MLHVRGVDNFDTDQITVTQVLDQEVGVSVTVEVIFLCIEAVQVSRKLMSVRGPDSDVVVNQSELGAADSPPSAPSSASRAAAEPVPPESPPGSLPDSPPGSPPGSPPSGVFCGFLEPSSQTCAHPSEGFLIAMYFTPRERLDWDWNKLEKLLVFHTTPRDEVRFLQRQNQNGGV